MKLTQISRSSLYDYICNEFETILLTVSYELFKHNQIYFIFFLMEMSFGHIRDEQHSLKTPLMLTFILSV